MVGCSPWGREESDTTERLHFDFSLSCIGEGNGNTLQYSCLENPRDGRAWWAAIYGVAQSRTRLKRLSSSSSSMLLKFITDTKTFINKWSKILRLSFWPKHTSICRKASTSVSLTKLEPLTGRITINYGKILRDVRTRPLYLSPEKPVCGSRSNSYYQTQNNGLVRNWERSMWRLYTVTLLI